MPVGEYRHKEGAAMRLIHLSDLHLGKKLNEASLVEDQRHILMQIAEIAQREEPDAVLIAGDVYDRPIPSAEAVGLLDDFLTLLARRKLPVILISGNHDSAERLAFGARLLTAEGVHISAAFDAAHTAIKPVRFTDEHGAVNIWPVPFIKPAHVRAALPDAPAATYTEALGSVIAAMPIRPEERNILVCHQFVTGALRSESEEVPVGGLDNVDAAVFAPFDYVALGHLHRPQRIGRDTARYCGSPLKYSFSEVGDTKSITVVELGSKGDVSVRAVPLTPLRELRELRGLYSELTLRDNYTGTAFDDYLHVTLTDEDDIPDALSKLQVIYPNLLKLDYDNARTRNNQQLDAPDAAARRSPMELLTDFFALQNNQPLNESQRIYAQAVMEKSWEGRA
jgi:DNA repair protein SbcD/Mre11